MWLFSRVERVIRNKKKKVENIMVEIKEGEREKEKYIVI